MMNWPIIMRQMWLSTDIWTLTWLLPVNSHRLSVVLHSASEVSMIPEWRSRKYRWPQVEHWSVPANHVLLVRLTFEQFIFWPKLPPNAGFGIKNLKKIFWGCPPAPTPSTATCRERGHNLPRCWDLGLGNRSPKSKFTTTPLLTLHLWSLLLVYLHHLQHL